MRKIIQFLLLIILPISIIWNIIRVSKLENVQAQQVELACPAGTRAVDQLSTRNPNTGNIRQYACVDNNGNLSLQGGLGGATIVSGTAVMTTNAINSLTCSASPTIVAAAGVLTTDSIVWSFNNSPANNGVTLFSWPTSGNVNFEYCNPTAGTVTPGAQTLNWRVLR